MTKKKRQIERERDRQRQTEQRQTTNFKTNIEFKEKSEDLQRSINAMFLTSKHFLCKAVFLDVPKGSVFLLDASTFSLPGNGNILRDFNREDKTLYVLVLTKTGNPRIKHCYHIQ